jgi:hypothetical protein
MGEIVDYYSKYAYEIISKGYVKGGIKALKGEFPEAYRVMEENLGKNFTKAGIDKYCKNFVAGLKKVGKWKDV